MPGSPGNALRSAPANPLYVTSDSFGGDIILGCERRYTIPEKFVINVPGATLSTVIPPVGVRLLISGVSFSWAMPPVAAVQASAEATLAGSGLLGTSDQTLGTYLPITENLNLSAGRASDMLPAAHPSPLNIITAEGDGLTPVFQINATVLVPPDAIEAIVYYSPIYGEKPEC